MIIFHFRKQMREYEGKTIKEVEEYLKSKKSFPYIYNWKTLLIAFSLGVLLLAAGGIIWNLNSEITRLNQIVLKLTKENESLKSKLTIQAASQQVAQPRQVISHPPAPKNDDYIYHSIQSGDSLSLISKRYYNTIKYAPDLAQLNGILVNSQLSLGQIIKVPRQPEITWTGNE